jgi:chromosome segregation ATPase
VILVLTQTPILSTLQSNTQAYLSLREEWEVAEDEIAQLEQELKQKTGKKGKRSDDDYGDAAEVERLQRQVDDNDRVLAAKNEKIDDLEQRLKSITTELAESKRIEKAQSDQIATIQKEMANRQNEGQQNRSDVNKLKKDLTKANEENRRLYDENDKLQQSVRVLSLFSLLTFLLRTPLTDSLSCPPHQTNLVD